MNSMARRMFELVEPIGVIPYSADEPNEAMFALGFTAYWDTYFAGRAAPLGLVPAEVVDALFYNFARAAELLTKAATSAPVEGRPMYAALRTLSIPDDVVTKLFHAASLLREHR